MELTRRGFLKSVGAATLAVAAVGLLWVCWAAAKAARWWATPTA